tara:strand:- start:860 stop:1801 length:942 start_codon:yes stop_codon:yes gene_type:complete
MEIKRSKRNKLLIVGGTGFIGKHVVKKALELNFKITVISKNKPKTKNKFPGVSYLIVDISNKKKLRYALKNLTFSYIINLGGYINHSNYFKRGSLTLSTHYEGIKNLFDSINRSKLKRFVQVGSSDEYGNNLAPQHENQREAPISIYSCAKVLATYFLQTLHKTENFPVVILRPFLVYGPDQGKDRFIPQIIRGCISDSKFPVSKGDQLRDFLYIDDFVNAVFKCLILKNVIGEVINISSGIPTLIKDVVNKISYITKSGKPQFGKINYRKGENMVLYADINKAKKLLNWKPKISLEQGLYKTIKNYKKLYEK